MIYGLRDPRTLEVRYIGQTCRGFVRPRVHSWYARKGENSYKARWIRSLQKIGLKPDIVVLEETTKEQLDAREIWWIAKYRATGRLTNLSAGGGIENARAAGRAAQAKTTPEQRDARLRGLAKAVAISRQRTTEERRASALKTVSAERWRAVGIHAASTQTKEQQRANGHKGGTAGWAKLTKEQRSIRARKSHAAMTAEQRSARSRAINEAMTSEQKSARERARQAGLAAMTKEQRLRAGQARSRTIFATTTPEQRRERARAASHSIPPEQRGKFLRKYWSTMTPEQRQKEIRDRWAKITPEQRSAQALKAWATRRAKKESES